MYDSILLSIKKLLGIDASYEVFDVDIIACINTAITILGQLGVGEQGSFMINGADETWTDYIQDQNEILAMVKSFIHMKVKMMFDPPQSSILNEVYTKQLDELSFRISVTVDPKSKGA